MGSLLTEDYKGWLTDRQAELLTERVESGAVTYSLTPTTERDYEVTAQTHDGTVADVFVSQDDASTAYSDAMLDHAERLADMADARNDEAKDAAMGVGA